MKIAKIETIPIRVPLTPELVISSGRGGAHIVSPFLLVKIHTDEGIIGVGEASCTPRWSGEDQVTGAHLIRTYLEPLLLGEDPTQAEQVTANFRLAFAANYFTKSAVEMALWDIAGKVATSSRSRCQLWQAWPSQTTYLDLVSNSTTKR